MTPAVSLVLFVLIGFVAGVTGKGNGSGQVLSIIVGILGAWVGGNILDWLWVTDSMWFGRLGLREYEAVISLIMAGAGAILFLYIKRLGRQG